MSYATQVQLESDDFMAARVKVMPQRITPTPSLDDVLYDQFALLLDSRDNTGASDAERDRLNRVTKILLEPFEEPVLSFAFAAWQHQASPVI
jgi:hypothetical protein